MCGDFCCHVEEAGNLLTIDFPERVGSVLFYPIQAIQPVPLLGLETCHHSTSRDSLPCRGGEKDVLQILIRVYFCVANTTKKHECSIAP